MTGTALTEAEEFYDIYKLNVVSIPTNKSLIRKDSNDQIFRTEKEKYNAIINKVADCKSKGQPVLVGTTSIEKSEKISNLLSSKNLKHNVLNAKFHEQEAKIIAEAGKKITPRFVKEMIDSKKVDEILVPFENIIGRFSSVDVINENTGEIWLEAGEEITCEFDKSGAEITGGNLKKLFDNGITSLKTLDIDNVNVGPYIRNTMASDKNYNRDMALVDIYKVMRPGEPPTIEAAADLFNSLFFEPNFVFFSLLSESPFNLFVALCSANFLLSKSLEVETVL